MRIRYPVVSGQFYPASPSGLQKVLDEMLRRGSPKTDRSLEKKTLIGGVIPHAGYIYSGGHALPFFELVRNSRKMYETVIIVHPNHTGIGPAIALDENDAWNTPLGNVVLDREFMEALPFPRSSAAHVDEHSAEVMLPFLQHFLSSPFQIVPVCMKVQTFVRAREIAVALHKAASALQREILVIASSDFSHFMTVREGFESDELAIREILDFNSEKVEEVVTRNELSICGYGPIMCLVEFAKMRTATPGAKILSRGHSGEITESDSVVDYITILFYDEA
jgi:MEMO1 family protein